MCPTFDPLKLTEQIPHWDESKVFTCCRHLIQQIIDEGSLLSKLKKEREIERERLPTIGMSLKILLSFKECQSAFPHNGEGGVALWCECMIWVMQWHLWLQIKPNVWTSWRNVLFLQTNLERPHGSLSEFIQHLHILCLMSCAYCLKFS